MSYLKVLLSVLVFPLTLLAGPVLEYPAEIKVRVQPTDEYYRVSPTRSDAKAIVYVALDDLAPFPSEELRDSRKMIVLVKANRVGRFRFKAIGTLNDELTVTRFDLVVVGDALPIPPAPTPPTPFPPDPKPPVPPDPVPPTPTPPVPPPTPAPIPGPGFKVLITYETGGLTPRGQQGILFGKNARDALDKYCGKDGYRIFDKDVDARNDLKIWADAMERTRGKQVPHIIISNGTTGFEGPLPADTGTFIQLLEKYAK